MRPVCPCSLWTVAGLLLIMLSQVGKVPALPSLNVLLPYLHPRVHAAFVHPNGQVTLQHHTLTSCILTHLQGHSMHSTQQTRSHVHCTSCNRDSRALTSPETHICTLHCRSFVRRFVMQAVRDDVQSKEDRHARESTCVVLNQQRWVSAAAASYH